MPERPEQPRRDAARRDDRLPVLASALATMLVVVVPYAVSGGPNDPTAPTEVQLPAGAQRVLDEVPAAFETDGLVVVPAGADPGVAWAGEVGRERVDGEVVELGVRGIVELGYLPSSGEVPAWAVGLVAGDRVRSDTGPLAFACTRWPGASRCSGSLLARVGRSHYLVRSGLDIPEDDRAVLRFDVLDLGVPARLTLGVMRPGAVRVELEGARGQVPARTSETGAVAGRTLWWAVSDEAPQVLESFDASGALLERVDLGG